MKIAITGGSGLVGKALSQFLIENGHEVFILSRTKKNHTLSSNPRYISWLNDEDQPELELVGVNTIVNLAGATINSRWTATGKARILNSRIKAVNEISRVIEALPTKPTVFINASAVGFYGTSETAVFTEDSANQKKDFLSETVTAWEAAACKINSHGVRTVFCRFGVILDQKEGALPKMVLPYRFYSGGTIGTGRQWVSWIHIKDVIRGILFIIETEKITGAVNFTAPEPVRMNEFGKTIASVLNRPHWLPVPELALRMLLGEMSTLILEGQQVLPEKLVDNGFSFHYPQLHQALQEIFLKSKTV